MLRKQNMLKLANNTPLSHALLLSGGTFEHQQACALEMARKLLCERRLIHKTDKIDPKAPKCQCQSCHWMEKKTHPDVVILPTSEINNDQTIKIDDIRWVSAHLNQTAHQGKYKIAILLRSNRMPLGAMNALLKTLEEPPSGSYLFLLSEYPHLLPATIRSRCQKIVFPTVKTSSTELVDALIKTLKSLKKNTISPFECAAKWQSYPILDILDGLYYCLLESKAWGKNLFIWQDYLNTLRRQILNKHNPNALLALEHLFYQWTKLV